MVKSIQFFLLLFASLFLSNTYAAEFFVNVGAISYDAEYLVGNPEIDNDNQSGTSVTLSAGIRNLVGVQQKHAIGFGIDTFEVEDQRLIGLRAIDYQFQLTQHLRTGAFVGAATIDSGLPQNGYYLGINLSLTDLPFNTDVLLEFRNGNGLARDRLLDDDPQGTKPDMFLDFNAMALTLNWRF